MWYGGEGRNVPLAKYIGGNLQKFDYVNATHMNKATLDCLAGKCGVSGDGIRYYIIVNGGFKLLYSDDDILEQSLKHLDSRQITIYVEYMPPAPEEVVVECTEDVNKEKMREKLRIKNAENTEPLSVGDDNENTENAGAEIESGKNTQPPILPPVVDEEVEPSILTEPGPGPSQPYVQGPSMWTQLQMAHTGAPVQTAEMTLMPRLNIRAPPLITGTGFMPCFTTKLALPVAKTIIKQYGQKFVDLSTLSRDEVHRKKKK
ncbi:hypothetical protein Salat_0148800 [Sesamum alatum]|uniref:Uncharacterized protein n=1 Tax=Sesamum alatum TaxID=300844 RepID=A0AAE1YXL2_9LAMI|nr:hypothetical protein Salat_0148800 [Sesamum alatum]